MFGVAALIAFTPFMLDWILHGDRTGHVQSLILGAVLALIAVQMFALGVVGDAIAGQRVIAQRTFERVRRLELEAGIEPSHYEAAAAGGPGAPRADGHGRFDRGAGPKRGRRLTAAATSPPIAGGNVYDKYGSRNPVERRLVGGFLNELERLVDRHRGAGGARGRLRRG